MSIGGGIALFVIGAILAFAIHIDQSVVDLQLVGYLLMGAGVVVFLIGLVFVFRRRSAVTTTTTSPDGQSRVTRSSVDGNERI